MYALFHNNTVPLYFISPTRSTCWASTAGYKLFYLTYFDSFERTHSRVFVPRLDRRALDSMGDVCNHLLTDPRRSSSSRAEPRWQGLLCDARRGNAGPRAQSGSRSAPPVELRERLGSKIAYPPGRQAGVQSAHVMGRAGSYDELLAHARSAGLGDDLAFRSPMATPAAGHSRAR